MTKSSSRSIIRGRTGLVVGPPDVSVRIGRATEFVIDNPVDLIGGFQESRRVGCGFRKGLGMSTCSLAEHLVPLPMGLLMVSAAVAGQALTSPVALHELLTIGLSGVQIQKSL